MVPQTVFAKAEVKVQPRIYTLFSVSQYIYPRGETVKYWVLCKRMFKCARIFVLMLLQELERGLGRKG